MSQTVIGVIGVIGVLASIIGSGLQIPSCLVSIHQLRDIRNEGKEMKFLTKLRLLAPLTKRRLLVPFAWVAVCVCVGIVGFVLLVRQPHKTVVADQHRSVNEPEPIPVQQQPTTQNIPKAEGNKKATHAPTKSPVQAKQEASQSVGGVDCTANQGNCAGINNGAQVVNQYGPPKMVMTDAQRDAIRDAMGQFVGIEVTIICDNPTDDSMAFANQLAKGLGGAGITVNGPFGAMGLPSPGSSIPSGISLTIGENRLNAATVLATTLHNLGLAPNFPIPATRASPDKPDELDILIVPNR
jgi:hypothetical protein